MAKNILTAYLAIYSILRIVAMVLLYATGNTELPISVAAVTTLACATVMLLIVFARMLKLRSGNVRLSLFVFALTTPINMGLILLSQADIGSMWYLLVTGTFFDILLYLGCLTFKIEGKIKLDTVKQ